MASPQTKDGIATAVELEGDHQEFEKANINDLKDADDALKIMHTHYEPFTPAEERTVLRKIDLRLALLMTVVNGIQFVDKLTISQAATYGLIKQAHLVGQEFSLLISIFYIGYMVAQYPTNLLMQKYPIGKYITINFVLWGIVLAATGACTSFGSLAACRFLLGVFESCLNPGFVLITSSWWKRSEQPFRTAIWYCANGLSSLPAGIAFYGIAHLNARGLFPYQWMFIIFGIFTIGVGLSLWWLLPDSPTTAPWLTERERIIAVERLKENKTGIKNTTHKPEQVKEALTDPKVWLLVIAVFVHNMTNSLQSNFQGLIIKGFGYNTYDTVLLSMVGPSILVVVMLVVMWGLSTKYGQDKRIYAIMILYLPGILAGAILYASPIKKSTKGLHLFAIFIIPIVAIAAGILYSLLASNVAGYTKKTVAGSMFFMSYCVANIVSPQAFLTKEAPRYTTGVAVSLACFCLNIFVFALLRYLYTRDNAKRDQDVDGQVSTDDTQDLVDAFSDLTELKNKKFRYTK